MLYYYQNHTDFLLTSYKFGDSGLSFVSSESEFCHLFGYCINSDFYRRNQKINSSDFKYLKLNNIDVSGLYCALYLNQGKVELIIDPMCQFNLFYSYTEEGFILSTSLELIRKNLNDLKINDEYLYDQLAYQSPMRGLTILESVYYIQFDDLAFKQNPRKEFSSLDNNEKISISRPDYNKYDSLNYHDLIKLYSMRLKSKARIVSSLFDEIHIQLTGGADSRLSLSAFDVKSKVKCYVYGNGESQNRLIFEQILNSKNISKTDKVKFVGHPLNNTSKIFKGLLDSNFLKSNNLNTYMNGPIDGGNNVCKITGYYGANVCGGVVLPPKNTLKNSRINKIPAEKFTYHDYVDDFSNRHSEARPSSFNDMFYINNRGKGHYASHSIADNKSVASIDLLYDYLNLLIVEKCPYEDLHIDKNAISIDLIYENDHQLALFPYDDRRIPKYRDFKEVPLINCFDGYHFPHKEVEEFVVVTPVALFEEYDYLNTGKNYMSMADMFKINELKDLASNYQELDYLIEKNDIQANIYLYFLLGKFYFEIAGQIKK